MQQAHEKGKNRKGCRVAGIRCGDFRGEFNDLFFLFSRRIIVAFAAFFITLLRFLKMVDVAQLVRASDCDSESRGFESRHPPQLPLLFCRDRTPQAAPANNRGSKR